MTSYYPDGSKEVLLNVNRYDYSWHTNFIYETPKILPAGTRIEVTAHYDNSESIKESVPKLNIERPVRFGAPTTDEMMNPFVAWTYIEPEEAEAFRATGSTQASSQE